MALVRELESAWAGRDPDPAAARAPGNCSIVASIVEKESGLPQELPKIAGLYLHRLRIGMRLQADPTVIYGLGEHYDGELHSVDLRTDGPYNTYTRAGLPPTPIALAGAAAIRATAHPENTDALYFVASPKDDGSHVFSATLEEQNAAVAALCGAPERQRGRGGRAMSAARPILDHRGHRGGRQDHAGGAALEGACRARASRTWSRANRAARRSPRQIRELVLTARAEALPDAAELLLMFAARSVHFENLIEPQSARRPLGDLRSLHGCDLRLSGCGPRHGASRASRSSKRLVQGARRPDLTLLLELPVAAGLGARAHAQCGAGRARDGSLRA